MIKRKSLSFRLSIPLFTVKVFLLKKSFNLTIKETRSNLRRSDILVGPKLFFQVSSLSQYKIIWLNFINVCHE